MKFLSVRQTWDPLAVLHQRMQEHLNWLLESEPESRALDNRAVGFFPLINLSESAEAYHLVAEAPGVKPEHLDIDLSEEGLSIRCRRGAADGEKKDESFRRQERWHGSAHRELTFPKRVNPDEATAELHAGVLRMTIPKAEPAKRRKIDVATRT